jgi:hypothetical protein
MLSLDKLGVCVCVFVSSDKTTVIHMRMLLSDNTFLYVLRNSIDLVLRNKFFLIIDNKHLPTTISYDLVAMRNAF